MGKPEAGFFFVTIGGVCLRPRPGNLHLSLWQFRVAVARDGHAMHVDNRSKICEKNINSGHANLLFTMSAPPPWGRILIMILIFDLAWATPQLPFPRRFLALVSQSGCDLHKSVASTSASTSA